ncbi:hypothetical protein ACSLBF_13720 [Pseudoalteromonas sp. T1lg65]|uniref:hypothetical protein n=1 Tax=Pseudoalteromonas sp. T1lg65 TaxID=2077101 RepID=UPI003F7A5A3C
METNSKFVTTVAWIFILLSGYFSFASLFQVVIISMTPLGSAFSELSHDEFIIPLLEYVPALVYVFFALWVITLISSVKLLQRKNWARVTFISLLSLGIIWQIVRVILQFVMISQMPDGKGIGDFANIMVFFFWLNTAFAMGVSGVLVWIIKRLLSPKIVKEFSMGKSE